MIIGSTTSDDSRNAVSLETPEELRNRLTFVSPTKHSRFHLNPTSDVSSLSEGRRGNELELLYATSLQPSRQRLRIESQRPSQTEGWDAPQPRPPVYGHGVEPEHLGGLFGCQRSAGGF